MERFDSWKDWFYFTKAERRGLAVFFVLFLFIGFFPKFYESIQKQPDYSEHFQDELNALETISFENQSNQAFEKSFSQPNTKQPQRPFTNSSDLEEDQSIATSFETNVKVPTDKAKPKQELSIDINQANAEDFAKLKGIGPILSERIIKFRNALGGFVSINQVGDTFGIEPEVFSQIKSQLIISNNNQVKQLNLNEATVDELKSHPYISDKLASQIINYRDKVHSFQTMDDVKALYLMNDELFNKLSPYLTF